MLNTDFLDNFYRIALMVTNQIAIILIIAIGYVFLKKDIFARALFIFTFAMILSAFIKSIFQIPLPPSLNKTGWAFPSGHMLTASTLWLWLAWEYKNKILYIWTILLLTSIGLALVHLGYHYPQDIAGALGFSIATLIIYNFILKLSFIKNNPFLIGFILTIAAIPIIYFIPNAQNLSHVWIALSALSGSAVGYMLNIKFLPKNAFIAFSIKFSIFILIILGLIAVEYLYKFISINLWTAQITHFFIVASWISFIPQFIIYKLFKNQFFTNKNGIRA